jgi:membrane associated rhomboid family serine protease
MRLNAAWLLAAKIGAILVAVPPAIYATYVWLLPILNYSGSLGLIVGLLVAAVLAFYSARTVMGPVAAVASAIVVAAVVAWLTPGFDDQTPGLVTQTKTPGVAGGRRPDPRGKA